MIFSESFFKKVAEWPIFQPFAKGPHAQTAIFKLFQHPMSQNFFQDQSFDKGTTIAEKSEYENCTFRNCDLSGAGLSGSIFIDCSFTGCNLSMAKLVKTAFRGVKFQNCKMMGLQLGDCSEFALEFSFDGCVLDHSSFYQMKLKKTRFTDCRMVETDLTSADLTEATFSNCDLSGATFDNTTLEKADLRTAYNYSIDPERNKIKKAKVSLAGIPGLLYKYDLDIEM
ncbi:MAG: pentapeptide repeat-containing protein [Flavipsychrobacter sp.]|jgi:uncharacterized protein YjbI with pentapeptide repeats|nr:pentapeptide repeat-containing protein [Flavipsychrobacter sp.]